MSWLKDITWAPGGTRAGYNVMTNQKPNRKPWDQELAKLEQALKGGNYAYGGYDNALKDLYQRVGSPSGVSYQEAQGTLGNLYERYFGNQSVLGSTDGITGPNPINYGDGGGGTDTSYLDQAQSELSARLKTLKPQFDELTGKERTNLKDQYGKSKTKYTEAFGEERDGLEKAYATAVSQLQNFLSGRNIVDSSYAERGRRDADIGFDHNVQKQGKRETETFSDLDKYLREGNEAIDRMQWNYGNPEAPKFGSMDEALAYKQQLDSWEKSLKDSYASARASSAGMAYKPSQAETMMEFMNGLAGLAQYGGNQMVDNAAMDYIKGYIGDEKSRKYYLDAYKQMQSQNTGFGR
jgi:hypothetical protein